MSTPLGASGTTTVRCPQCSKTGYAKVEYLHQCDDTPPYTWWVNNPQVVPGTNRPAPVRCPGCNLGDGNPILLQCTSCHYVGSW